METTPSPVIVDSSLLSKTILKSWTLQVSRINDFLTGINDDTLQTDTAPGRNSGVYLLGHLVATNDSLFPLLGLGEKRYPELGKVFVTSPDKSGAEFPSIETLKKYWKEVSEKLEEQLSAIEPDEWLSKHEAVNAEDFAKEPHRNKLNVVISRTAHMSYHLGQLVYLKAKAE